MRCFSIALLVAFSSTIVAANDNRLMYLDENNPWYPHTEFPKLTTPQWVGEEGVEAVVILAIDDMRDTAKYESYLRPILQRLKKIDGRAPASIMTCSVKPDDPQLQTWLDEGVSIEVHTVDHPCPLLQGGNFDKAKSTYDRCVDLLNQIPGNKPVAFRMPCCDSLNTVSPRFYEEIFNSTTPQGNHLGISTSVFNVFTSDDPQIPRELVIDADGNERFRRYLPKGLKRGGVEHNNFSNWIENYPYPYVVNRLCWEFPCMVPSDWEAQHLQQPNNPKTVEDMKTALDITVLKQGVFCLVFHPHGWIRNDQVVELIDHATAKHGEKVKFLNFREALDRLNTNLTAGQPLRDSKGKDNGVRVVDVEQNGILDVVIGNEAAQKTRIWQPRTRAWLETPFHGRLTPRSSEGLVAGHASQHPGQFVRMVDSGALKFVDIRHFHGASSGGIPSLFRTQRYQNGRWQPDKPLEVLMHEHVKVGQKHPDGQLASVVFHEVSPHGSSLALVTRRRVMNGVSGFHTVVYSWTSKPGEWQLLRTKLPSPVAAALSETQHSRLRFADIDGDGDDDVLLSELNDEKPQRHNLSLWLVDWFATGEVRRVDLDPDSVRPLLDGNGRDNGFFIRDGHLCWQNEDTDALPDMLHRVSIEKLLQPVKIEQGAVSPLKTPDPNADPLDFPLSKTPEESLATIRTKPGLKVELVAAEPLIRDPVAFEWDINGRLWVVEMGDYPNGSEARPSDSEVEKKGGRIRVLEDADGDGCYDKATTFLDGIGFPSGIHRWANGVLVTAAPEIFYAEDSDGDGKADIRRTLYRGFGEGNQQHRVNGMRWGLDNWLHLANGDSDGSIKALTSADGTEQERDSDTQFYDWQNGRDEVFGPGQVVDIRGRDLRIFPASGTMDPLSGRTQFGRARDDWGNWFGCNNSNPMWHFVLSDHYLRRNPHATVSGTNQNVPEVPGAAPVFPISRTLARYNDFDRANRFTSACSTMIYRDSMLGEEFYGDAFTCEPVHNLVSRLVLTADGVTFKGRRAASEKDSEFLASTDNWFRPTMVRTGPDGALYIADMYRFVIEHPKWIPADVQQKLNLQAGNRLGRIYRVVRESNGNCCGTEATAEGETQDSLRNWLKEDWDEVPAETLVKRLASPNGWWRDTAQRLLVTRHEFDVADRLWKMVVEHESPLARLHALCTLPPLLTSSEEALIHAVQDKHPAVRRHAIRYSETFIHRDDFKKLAAVVLARVDDPDPQVRLQLAYSLGAADTPAAGRVLGQLALKHADDRWMLAAILSSLDESKVVPALDAVLTQNAPQRLIATLLGQAAAFNRLDAVMKPLGESLPQSESEFSVNRVNIAIGIIEEVRRHNVAWKTLKDSESLKDLWAAAVATSLSLALDRSSDAKNRIAAIRLAAVSDSLSEKQIALLASLISPQESQQIQLAAVSALAEIGRGDVPDRLLAGWKGHTPSMRREVVEHLLQRDAWCLQLLKSIEAEAVLPTDLAAVHRERLVTHRNSAIRDRAEALFKPSGTTRKAIVDEFTPALNLSPDAARGQTIFTKRCAACHKLSGIGKSIGADLAALKDRSGQALLTAILDPNRAVEAKFQSYTVITESGRSFSGMLLTETGNSITLIGVDGMDRVLGRNEIDTLVSTNRSLMPEGLEKDLSMQDLADVIAFVQSVGVRSKAFDGNRPHVIHSGDDGSLTLPATAAEIYGPTLVFEQTFQNLGFWGSDQDHADWTLDLDRAGTFKVELEYACEKSVAGNVVEVRIGESVVSDHVASTGRWEDYRTVALGTITIPKGRSRVIVASKSKPNGFLMDLKAVRLIPESTN